MPGNVRPPVTEVEKIRARYSHRENQYHVEAIGEVAAQLALLNEKLDLLLSFLNPATKP